MSQVTKNRNYYHS